MTDWYKSTFDDSAWGTAAELGTPPSAPWNNLWKRPIPQWKDYGIKDYQSIELHPEEYAASIEYSNYTAPYTLEADFTILQKCAGIIFGAKDTNNFYMTKRVMKRRWYQARRILSIRV